MINYIKANPKRCANAFIVLAGILLLLLYPWRHTMWLGLAYHMSGAAFIGGLADWYAVVALFRKPLGIPWKTELVPRRKARLIELAEEMVAHHLLEPERIYEVIQEEEVPRKILTYLVSDTAKEQLDVVLEEIRHHILPYVEESTLRDVVNQVICVGMQEWKATPVIVKLGQQLLANQSGNVLWKQLNRFVQRLLVSGMMQQYIVQTLTQSIHRYTEDDIMRKLLVLFGGSSCSPVRLAEMIQYYGAHYLESQEDIESPLGQAFKRKCLVLLDELSRNTVWQTWIEDNKEEWIRNALDDVEFLQVSDWNALLDQLSYKARYMGIRILENESDLQRLEGFMMTQVGRLLKVVHPLISKAVVTTLSQYSTEKLVHELEGIMNEDLQIIRINGAIVGAVLGGIFHLLYVLVRGGAL